MTSLTSVPCKTSRTENRPARHRRPVQETPLFLYRSHQKTIAVQKTPPFLYGTPP